MSLILKSAINDFLASLKSTKSLNTLKNYTRYLNHFLEFASDQPLTSLTPALITNYRSYLASANTKLSLSSQNYHLTALRQFLSVLRDQQLSILDPNLIKLHPIPKTPTPMPDSNLTPLSADNLRDQLILALLQTTGLKVSEIVALDVSDIMPNLRQITVGCYFAKQRALLLEPSVSLILEKYLKTRRGNETPLFTRLKSNSHTSTRLTPRTIQRIVRKLNPSEAVTPSTIRNQFAAHLFAEGISTTVANQLLGHTRKSSTVHYKTKLNQSRLEPS